MIRRCSVRPVTLHNHSRPSDKTRSVNVSATLKASGTARSAVIAHLRDTFQGHGSLHVVLVTGDMVAGPD